MVRMKMILARAFVLSLFFPLIACSANPPAPADSAPPSQAAASAPEPTAAKTAVAELSNPANYIIQPGDLLEVSVWREKDLQREVLVRPDGGINFPLVNEMMAAGNTLGQLRQALTEKLAKYVPDPVVTISIKQSSGNKIYVVGKVKQPGEFVATRNMDVMQALSMAGGPTPFASVNNIKILRRKNGELTAIPFKYSRVEKGKDLEQNILLQGGDVIVVP